MFQAIVTVTCCSPRFVVPYANVTESLVAAVISEILYSRVSKHSADDSVSRKLVGPFLTYYFGVSWLGVFKTNWTRELVFIA